MPPAEPVRMKPRWISWVFASVVLPGLPWLFAKDDREGVAVLTLTCLALLCQLMASIWVAVGLSRHRGLSGAAAVGFSVVFMLASVALGTAVWFAACVGFLSTQHH